MKTEQEIREEIKTFKTFIEINRNIYKMSNDINSAILANRQEGYVNALQFVLDEIEE